MKWFRVFMFLIFSAINVKVKAWEIDFSRRQMEFDKVEDVRMPASAVEEESAASLISKITKHVEPSQDIVILNTESGFVPEVIKLKKDVNYNIHVVNVNNKEKNVSFLLDSFSQSHSTVFGAQKVFSITPRTEGIFSYQCPETSKQGKFVIVSEKPTRKIASEEKEK